VRRVRRPRHNPWRSSEKTFLRRKCPGKTMDFQMIAANINVAFISTAVIRVRQPRT